MSLTWPCASGFSWLGATPSAWYVGFRIGSLLKIFPLIRIDRMQVQNRSDSLLRAQGVRRFSSFFCADNRRLIGLRKSRMKIASPVCEWACRAASLLWSAPARWFSPKLCNHVAASRRVIEHFELKSRGASARSGPVGRRAVPVIVSV